MRFGRGVFAPAAALFVASRPAAAHLINARFGDFYGGALHPLISLESVLPWLALGLLAGLHGARGGRWMLLAFPLGIAVGVAASQLLPSADNVLAAFNLAAFVVVGLLIVVARPLPPLPLLGLGVVFGIGQGWENGLAIGAGTNVGLFVTGVTVAGYVVVALLTAVTVTLLRQAGWVRIAVRAAGSWITAVGLLVAGVKLLTA